MCVCVCTCDVPTGLLYITDYQLSDIMLELYYYKCKNHLHQMKEECRDVTEQDPTQKVKVAKKCGLFQKDDVICLPIKPPALLQSIFLVIHKRWGSTYAHHLQGLHFSVV